MAVSVTCSSVTKTNGRVYVTWSDGVENEFTSVQDALDFVRSKLSKDDLRAIGIAKALTVDTTGGASAASYLTGKTITADLTLAANLVRIT